MRKAAQRSPVLILFVGIILVPSVLIAFNELMPSANAETGEHLDNFALVAPPDAQRSSVESLFPGRAVYVPNLRLPGANEVPYRHGPYLVVPEGWRGELETVAPIPDLPPIPTETSVVTDLRVLTASDLWRDVAGIPEGFERTVVLSSALGYDIQQIYRKPAGPDSRAILGEVRTIVRRPAVRPLTVEVVGPMAWIESREVEGLPALVWEGHKPDGSLYGTDIWVFDEDSGVEYFVRAVGAATTSDALAVVRSLISHE